MIVELESILTFRHHGSSLGTITSVEFFKGMEVERNVMGSMVIWDSSSWFTFLDRSSLR
jgi:hypothetical protein